MTNYAINAVKARPRAVICEPGHRRSRTRDVIFLIQRILSRDVLGQGQLDPHMMKHD